MAGREIPQWNGGISPAFAVGESRGVRGALIEGAALNNLSSTMVEIAGRFKQEHDTAVAQDKINELRTVARTEMGNQTKRKGVDAVGAMADYQQFYEKAVGEGYNQLENGFQQEIFSQIARQRMDSDLDVLSRHEAAERQAHKVSAWAATKAGAIEEVGLNPKEDNIQKLLTEGHLSLTLAKPGMNVTAEYKDFEQKVRLSAINVHLKNDPLAAKELLKEDAWKKGLGSEYADVKELVDKEAAVEKAIELYPDDFDKQWDYIDKQKGLTTTSKQAAKAVINAGQAEEKSRDKEAKRVYRQDANNEFGQLMRDGDQVAAADLAGKWDNEMFTEVEKNTYIRHATAEKPFKSDPHVKREFLREIRKGTITDGTQIWSSPFSMELTAGDIDWLEGEIANEVNTGHTYGPVITDLEWTFKELYRDDSNKGLLLQIFHEELEKDMIGMEEKEKRRLTPQEVRQLGMDLITRHEDEDARWWQSSTTTDVEDAYKEYKKRYAEKRGLKDSGVATDKIPDTIVKKLYDTKLAKEQKMLEGISVKNQLKIVKILRAEKVKVTPATVAQFYKNNETQLKKEATGTE